MLGKMWKKKTPPHLWCDPVVGLICTAIAKQRWIQTLFWDSAKVLLWNGNISCSCWWWSCRGRGYSYSWGLLSTLMNEDLNLSWRTSLVAQWLRIRLPVQGTRVRALGREDSTCRWATKPVHHNYWAHMPQLLKPVCLEPMLCNKRSHRNEKPMHRNKE